METTEKVRTEDVQSEPVMNLLCVRACVRACVRVYGVGPD